MNSDAYTYIIYMGSKKSTKRKTALPLDFQGGRKNGLTRKYRKAILFNEREISAINQFCEKYGIRTKSAFFRSIIISHIMEQANDNYPKLF